MTSPSRRGGADGDRQAGTPADGVDQDVASNPGVLVDTNNAATDVQRPYAVDVAELTYLLDLMHDFDSNEQRARYLLSSNWLRDRGAIAAARIAAHDAVARVLYP